MANTSYSQTEKNYLFKPEEFNDFMEGDQPSTDNPVCEMSSTTSTDHLIGHTIYSVELGEIDEVLLGEWEYSQTSTYYEAPGEHCEVEQSKISYSRRSLKDACPLAHFFKLDKLGMPIRSPKHEYYMAMFIRALKKAIRTLLSGDRPKGGIFKVLESNPDAARRWEELRCVVEPYLQILAPIAKTEEGPATDGKARRKEAPATYSSFNKNYIKDFYSSPYMRVAHVLFTEMIFSASPSALCHAMKFSCCKGRHSADCSRKWDQLKVYTQENAIEEVGLQPFSY